MASGTSPIDSNLHNLPHEQRTEIKIAIVRRAPYRDIKGRFKVSKSAVARHAEVHLPEALAKSEEARKVADADTVLQQMVHLRDKALGILDRSEEAEDSKTGFTGHTRGQELRRTNRESNG